jgi:hypothetical protein
VVLKIHLVLEIKMTRVRFLNRRHTRTPITAVVNRGLQVAAVHAGLVTYIHTGNEFRAIISARPSPNVPALTASEIITTSIKFASVQRQYQYQWHQSRTSYRLRIRCGGS